MKFGSIQEDAGERSAPLLPPDHPSTTRLLNDTDSRGMDRREIDRALELFPPEEPEVRIGLSTWGDKRNRGVLYPTSAEPAEFLSHYGRVFSTVELSATFYGMPEAGRLTAWRDAVPESFRFLPKVSQSITHRQGLADAQQGLRDFLEHTAILGERRGPLLVQMPPRFAPSAVACDRVAAALAVLGRQAAVEFRHPAWFRDGPGAGPGEPGVPPAARLLREYGAALVVTDTMGAREVVHAILTSPVLVLRFVASGDLTVDAARVDAWTQRITDWLSRGLREVFVYVHLDDGAAALALAQRFASGLAAAYARVYAPRAPVPSTEVREDADGSASGRSADTDEGSDMAAPDGQLSLF
ncbi:MAG: DUF72 domain-containing protein [Alkalispirochaeta sp.]